MPSNRVFVNRVSNTLATNDYYPYSGNRGGAFRNLTTKRFTGQYHESSLPGGEGLSYYNARWYDPKLGRFLSADTIVLGPANLADKIQPLARQFRHIQPTVVICQP